jgi:acetoin utilization deacetylase AcuC-like enzyme
VVVRVLIGSHRLFEAHDTGPGHPEHARRLVAVREAIADIAERCEIVPFSPRAVTPAELGLVHPPAYRSSVEAACARGGSLDPDTVVSPASFEAALHAAGAGIEAAERLRAGEAESAFLALRPPGHHALAERAMGFCLFNNVAITASQLARRGERVAILDWDAHHGNGTETIFYERSDVLYLSLHQYPFYPGSGKVTDLGAGAGLGKTVNLPLPAGSAGDVYRAGFDAVIEPVIAAFSPDWLLVSAGFDGHRDDPLTDLGLSAGDFADLSERAVGLARPGRLIVFLEGGYDMTALRHSVAATVASLAGERYLPEGRTSGGWKELSSRGGARHVVEEARRRLSELGALKEP